MRRLLLVLLISSYLAVPSVQAQENWFFAWDNLSGAVAAYTAAGTNNPIAQVDEVFPIGWRLAPDQMLAVLSVGGSIGLYRLTPEAATPLRSSEDIGLLLTKARTLAARADPY